MVNPLNMQVTSTFSIENNSENSRKIHFPKLVLQLYRNKDAVHANLYFVPNYIY
jgi:hypothetical protein